MTEATTVAEITNQKPATLLKAAEPKAIRHDSEKWLKFFLNNKQIAFMRKLGFVRLTLRAAQYRDAHSTIPLPTLLISAPFSRGVMSVSLNVITPQGLEPLQFPTKFRSPSERAAAHGRAQLQPAVPVVRRAEYG